MRVLLSVLGGGVLYAVWLATMLAAAGPHPSPFPFSVMLTGPLVTAVGFRLGTLLGEHITHHQPGGWLQAWLWPLLGCTIGACAVYPLGPMLTVFGLFGLGTIAVAVRELRDLRRSHAG